MKLFLGLLLISSLALAYDASGRHFPSMWLSNWENMMLTWSGPRDNPNQENFRFPGPTSLRIKQDWDFSGLSMDSFSVKTNQKTYKDPTQWLGEPKLTPNGDFSVKIDSYGTEKLDFSLTRTIFFPPNEPFYIVKYQSDKDMEILDMIQTENFDQKVWGWRDINAGNFAVDLKNGKNYKLGFGAINEARIKSFSFAGSDIHAYDSPLSQFNDYGKLNNKQPAEDNKLSFGAIVSLDSSNKHTAYFYRTMGANYNDVAAAVERVSSKTGKQWELQTANDTVAFLNKGKQPSLDEAADLLYKNSILFLKHSQVPGLGTMVASFHPGYQFKVWGRDGMFAAMIMDAAGYHDEAEAYIKWAASAQLRGDGGFHTCYKGFTGEPVGFVEPQFDSAGAFLLAVYHHYKLTGDTNFVYEVLTRVQHFEDFFLNNVKLGGFVLPDYSIWEESSDGRTGKGLSTSYFTFTQSLAFGGLRASAHLRRILGNQNRAELLEERAEKIRETVEDRLWVKNKGFYARGMYHDSMKVDYRPESGTVAGIFTGMLTNTTRIENHKRVIRKVLTKQGHGIARYYNDPFFFDSKYNPGGREVGEASPPWGVTTMFMAMAEMTSGHEETYVKQRIQWMVEHAAPGGMAVGEAVDGVTGTYIMTSCPDIYEYAGVYVWTVLMDQKMARLPNPDHW
eukprot:TRINITY_DN2120_c0_g3_i1.p1 TRINITY_DN2120_c0_g3~~TRINITY_DN2120_c0_g3_i1.p1  ORF type:complete len:675 (-),score=222.85 TRINITY_DN2120_c0_g3_i1:513-2537(-)